MKHKIKEQYEDNGQTITVYENGRVRAQIMNREADRTQQQFKDECDINRIIAKYRKGEPILHLARKEGIFADVSQMTDYHHMVNQVSKANEAFALLPADLRDRFANDPSKLINFISNPSNYDEGVKLGLFEPKPSTAAPKTNDDLNDDKKTAAKAISTAQSQTPTPSPKRGSTASEA